jgi:hypothetical protein
LGLGVVLREITDAGFRQCPGALGIQLLIPSPFRLEVRLLVDCLDRTLVNAIVARNAIILVNIKHCLILVKTIHWANRGTLGILAVVAGFTNDTFGI